MPSGPKKRKAAKKKKEIQHSDHPGDDDLNQQFDKYINDGGALGSSRSQGLLNHQSLLAEGEKEEIEKGNDISNPGDRDHNDVRIEREFEIGDKLDEKNGRFVDDESVSKSSSDNSSESSGGDGNGSNSDDESHGIGNAEAAVDITPEVESVKAADYLSERSDETEHSALNEKSANVVVENSPPADLIKISLPCEEAEKAANSQAHSIFSTSAAESVFKENEEIKPSSIEDKVDISTAFLDAPSGRKEEAISQSIENVVTISDPKECTREENDDSLRLSHNEPRKDADNGVEYHKKSGVTEPLLVPSPIPVQTSWKGCCGLFEVFTGSSR